MSIQAVLHHPSRTAAVSAVVPDDAIIAEGDGVITRFADAQWDLRPLMGAPNVPASGKLIRFNFDVTSGQTAKDVPGQTLVLTAKEFAYARLIGPPPTKRRKSPGTVIIDASNLSIFGRWLLRCGISAYSKVTPDLLDEFKDLLMNDRTWETGDRSGGRGILQVALILRTVQSLWDYKEVLTDSLPFNP